MTNQETLDLVQRVTKVVSDAVTSNVTAALPDALKLLALLEVEFAPPIDATSLDPVDRAAVDAEVDAGVSKT
jgi:hypothetical protein